MAKAELPSFLGVNYLVEPLPLQVELAILMFVPSPSHCIYLSLPNLGIVLKTTLRFDNSPEELTESCYTHG